MSVLDVIKLRKSVRAYRQDKDLSAEDLSKILESARLAPSARNLQEWKFVIVKNKETLKELVPACKDQKFIGTCSCAVVACSADTDYIMSCGQPAYTVDLSIAVSHMALMAAELGIGSCWLGAFYEEKVKAILDIPAKVRVVAILTLGYPAGKELSEIVTTPRKPIEELVRYDKWTF